MGFSTTNLGAKPQAALFWCRWDQTVMVHFEAPPEWLRQRQPFELDLFGGKAYVSLVAFTMQHVRLARLGRAGAWVCRPFCPVRFLNMRTYVNVGGTPGIYFLTEWLSSRLTVLLEPALFGLPYCFGRSRYNFNEERRGFDVEVRDARLRHALRLVGDGGGGDALAPCEPQSLDAFLMERYHAFSDRGRRRRRFQVWHEPWLQSRVTARVEDVGLLRAALAWPDGMRMAGANYSPGVDAWVGPPRRLS